MKHNKPSIPILPNRQTGLSRFTRHCCLAAVLALSLNAIAQEVLWQESFETDGEGSRYTTEGVAVFERPSFADNGISADQGGPVYWTRIADGVPSFVGVPAPTPERRIVMAWGSGIAADDITDDFWTHFDGVADWLLRGKSNATILFSGLGGDGDQALASRLESKGHTVEEDAGGDLPESGIDMYVYSGGSTSRFVNYKIPGLHYNSSDLDDELLSSIGTPLTTTLPEVRISAPGHASAGGQEGSFPFVTNENTFQGIGTELPGGSTVVAAFVRTVSASVLDLEAADALFDGTTPNTGVSRTTLTVADIVSSLSPASQIPFFDWDNPIAGDPDGGFAVRATGKIEASAGAVSLAIGGADGSRLRIDLDGNGLSADDNVIMLDRRGAWQYSAPEDVTFPSAGSYDFEWVSFNAAAEFGSEFLVALDGGGGAPNVSEEAWDLVSASSAHVKIDGDITVETYVPDLPPEEVQTPFTLALESPDEGGAVFGGGPFGNFDGDNAYGGSALNKFTGDDGVGNPKLITWNDSIDISGKDNVKLTVATGASFLDFETGDYLKIYIDDGNDPLIWFTAPSGDDKFFNDVKTNPSNPTRLGLALQDITYDVPAGVNSIDLRIEAITTWWNEIVVFDNIRVTSGEIVVEPTPSGDAGTLNAPALKANGDVTLSWDGGGTLEETASIDGPWSASADQANPQTRTPSGTAFFRLVP